MAALAGPLLEDRRHPRRGMRLPRLFQLGLSQAFLGGRSAQPVGPAARQPLFPGRDPALLLASLCPAGLRRPFRRIRGEGHVRFFLLRQFPVPLVAARYDGRDLFTAPVDPVPFGTAGRGSQSRGFYLWAFRARFSFSSYFRIGRDINIDGLTRWFWQLPGIDTLLRTLLFTPQHLLSLAFLLLFLYTLSRERARPWALSFCLAASLAASFFIGGILLLSWGLYALVREGVALARGRRTFGGILAVLVRQFALPGFVLGLSLALKMIAFTGSGIVFKPAAPGEAMILLGSNLGLLTVAAPGRSPGGPVPWPGLSCPAPRRFPGIHPGRPDREFRVRHLAQGRI
ncbi:MAG: hypothetical protein MZV64_28875 [Ignavibacteriales bacterium]|nr:hypothetical protein [Ignavibacteriales bacterium]